MTIHPNRPRPRKADLIKEIGEQVENPIHKRILAAYSEANPVNSMELELQNILLEIINSHENQIS